MAAIYLTSDWHVGEAQAPHTHSFLRGTQAPHTHSFLRPRPTEIMVGEWIRHCHQTLAEDDTLIFLGDVGITLGDLAAYALLPKCRKLLVLGDKEYNNKQFSKEEFIAENARLAIFDSIAESMQIELRGRKYFLSHKPLDCFSQPLPALCGHVHGVWRSALMPNGQPIVNVSIDAWGGLVKEEFVEHQYNAITKFYDDNAFPARWFQPV